MSLLFQLIRQHLLVFQAIPKAMLSVSVFHMQNMWSLSDILKYQIVYHLYVVIVLAVPSLPPFIDVTSISDVMSRTMNDGCEFWIRNNVGKAIISCEVQNQVSSWWGWAKLQLGQPKTKYIATCRRLLRDLQTGFGLEDWIYWNLIHTTRNYR
jgi:hypothetical protein